jgi:hypothetical protein
MPRHANRNRFSDDNLSNDTKPGKKVVRRPSSWNDEHGRHLSIVLHHVRMSNRNRASLRQTSKGLRNMINAHPAHTLRMKYLRSVDRALDDFRALQTDPSNADRERITRFLRRVYYYDLGMAFRLADIFLPQHGLPKRGTARYTLRREEKRVYEGSSYNHGRLLLSNTVFVPLPAAVRIMSIVSPPSKTHMGIYSILKSVRSGYYWNEEPVNNDGKFFMEKHDRGLSTFFGA